MEETTGIPLYVKGDEHSLNGVGFKGNRWGLWSLALCWVGECLTIFGSNWNCHGLGRHDVYYVKGEGT